MFRPYQPRLEAVGVKRMAIAIPALNKDWCRLSGCSPGFDGAHHGTNGTSPTLTRTATRRARISEVHSTERDFIHFTIQAIPLMWR